MLPPYQANGLWERHVFFSIQLSAYFTHYIYVHEQSCVLFIVIILSSLHWKFMVPNLCLAAALFENITRFLWRVSFLTLRQLFQPFSIFFISLIDLLFPLLLLDNLAFYFTVINISCGIRTPSALVSAFCIVVNSVGLRFESGSISLASHVIIRENYYYFSLWNLGFHTHEASILPLSFTPTQGKVT